VRLRWLFDTVRGLSRRFAQSGRKKREKTMKIGLKGESSLPAGMDFHHLKFLRVKLRACPEEAHFYRSYPVI
jgi:hypothetical protein